MGNAITLAVLVIGIICIVGMIADQATCSSGHTEMRKIKGVDMGHFVCDKRTP